MFILQGTTIVYLLSLRKHMAGTIQPLDNKEIYKRLVDIQEHLLNLSSNTGKVMEYITGVRASSSLKGQRFQEQIYLELKGVFPEDKIIFTAGESQKGDIVIYPRIKMPTGALIESPMPIIIDAKYYTNTLPRSQLDKLFRDMERMNSLIGVIVSSNESAIKSYPSRYITNGYRTIFLVSSEGKGHILLVSMLKLLLSILYYQKLDVTKINTLIREGGLLKTLTNLEAIFREMSAKIDSWTKRLDMIRKEIDTEVNTVLSQLQEYIQEE